MAWLAILLFSLADGNAIHRWAVSVGSAGKPALATFSSSGNSTTAGDQVDLPKILGGGDAIVVVQGGLSGGDCVYDRVFKGSNILSVGSLVSSTDCPSEVAVFGKGQSMALISRRWTDGDDNVSVPTSQPRVKVALNLIIESSDSRAERWARRDTLKAITLFDRNRVGIIFTVGSITHRASLSAAQIAIIQALETGFGPRCPAAALNNLKGDASLYDPDRINVYFVNGMPWSWRAFNCWEDGVENVIFIAIGNDTPPTLAHELGHTMGLQDPNGHTGSDEFPRLEGFTPVNIMWTGLDDKQAKSQKHFSIGQAYRMNVDKSSWIHRTKDLIVATKTCHPNGPEDSIPCPFLALDTTAVKE